MTFSEVPAQAEPIEFFRRAFQSGRLAHAYILVGPPGVGKRDLARALAQYVFCEDRTDDSCGKCRPCRLIESEQFADLHWYRRLEGRQLLTVEVIERFQHEMSLKPVESDRKVFVVEDVDKLAERSSNKLLKVLEEPPPGALLMLLALDVRDFLPTVLSRCHVIRLRAQAVDELAKTLQNDHGCSAIDAKYLSHFTMGSPGLATELADGAFLGDREWLIELVVSVRNGDHFRAAEEILNLVSSRGDKAPEKREILVRLLDVMALFYRDILTASCGADPDSLVNVDRLDVISHLGATLSPDRVCTVIDSINAAREAVLSNANQKLLLDNLAFDVAQIQSL